MRARIKINPKTGIIYLPKVLIEDGFEGEVDMFGYGPVLVIVRPSTDLDMIIDCLTSVGKDIKMTSSMKAYSSNSSDKSKRR
ncbi:MAG: hypothetical protein NTW48_09885 [Chloroflexi bacterium]|nr:hypothetical protein [Chloroflexota bacterium]